MKKLQGNAIAKVCAWIVLLCAAFGTGVFGVWAVLSFGSVADDSWQGSSRYYQAVDNRQRELVAGIRLSQQLERLELLKNGNKSQDADRFVEAARAFIKKITDGFADNFTTENGEVLVYDLLTAYEAVMEAYEGLDGAERSLPEVETEKEALDKAWGEIDDKYKEIDPDLYRFLRAVYALQKRYDGLKGKEQETYPWNLQLAYEGCLDQKSGFEEKFSDNADFVKAAPVCRF